jgi:hypothetical protein
MRTRSIALSLAILISAAGNVSQVSSPALAAPQCLTAPMLSQTPDNSWAPTAGVSVKTWNFARGVSHPGPEATRVSVAQANLENFDLKPIHSGFPTVTNPFSLVTEHNAYAAINTDFFDLSWPAFAWGPVVRDRIPEYLPLVNDNGIWRAGWLKVVATTTAIPATADGYKTTGSLKTSGNEIPLDGVNLKTFPKNAAISYDTSFIGNTPKGESTLVVKNGLVIEAFPKGKSMPVPADSIVIQATGSRAASLRLIAVNPSAQMKIDGPIAKGFTTKGTVTVGKSKHAIVGVNLPGLKTGATVFNKHWKSSTTPRGSLTWVVKDEKVVKVFKTGSTVRPTSTTSVLQFVKPSASVRSVPAGASVKVSHSLPSTARGYRTSGVITAAAGIIPIEAINLAVANPRSALVFDSNWKSPTPRGSVTLKIANNVLVDVDPDGNTSQPATGEVVVQIPGPLVAVADEFSAETRATIEIDPPTDRINSLSSTLIRSDSTITVGNMAIPIGAINHNRIASDSATIYNKHWIGRNKDRLAQAGKSSVVVRDGKIAEIYQYGADLYVTQTDTVIQFPRVFRTQVSAWVIGTPVTIKLSIESKNSKELINAFGRGRPNLTSGQVVAQCDPNDDGVRPRTSIGWDNAGNVWLITGSPTGSNLSNDGYRDGGATVIQMAQWLQQLGATEAVSFDGGGSTWMMRNSSSGPRRVDMADPGNNDNPWIRWVPISLGIVDRED